MSSTEPCRRVRVSGHKYVQESTSSSPAVAGFQERNEIIDAKSRYACVIQMIRV